MINNVSLTGRLTRDIDLRYTQSGTAVGSFTLAVDRQFTNQQGQRETDFINCVIWRKSAENLSNFTRKGSLIGVEGHIQTRNYDNNQGQRVYVTEIVVENFALLESRATTQARPSEPAQPGNQSSNNYNPNFGGQPQQTAPQAPSFGSTPTPSSSSNNAAPAPAGNDNFANKDPFADSGKAIDISDDDLPF
ncbi:single-stranded DNA-binding protein [Lacticaseibacillus daqingensis]|uniref:single-stranded DNA-binding protein n=1 Tax=Lacticaseibacillus daqingensis TaxID=2486014 RepID=UPI000F7AA710|nr:single-stranded DNA-binding protein [Lacticaseibacillus daqingensis]